MTLNLLIEAYRAKVQCEHFPGFNYFNKFKVCEFLDWHILNEFNGSYSCIWIGYLLSQEFYNRKKSLCLRLPDTLSGLTSTQAPLFSTQGLPETQGVTEPSLVGLRPL